MFSLFKKTELPNRADSLAGRTTAIPTAEKHFVTGRPLKGPYPEGSKQIILGMGCFWGVERLFWEKDGVWVTSVGYAGGFTPNPTYREVCSGMTGHNEVVSITYLPEIISLMDLLKVFWENHDPTQGMRQGNDIGTQYRSGIYYFDAEQKKCAEDTREVYQEILASRRLGTITTEVVEAPEYFFAEDYHQQYLAKNPGGYCGLRGTGLACPIG
ncbi:MAG: peptide-methionine (S)-S-oxide reductase MsrA [Rhodobacteraceae bacterium]|nr:peptide-methionine (S)-S-oxide reductase MsrA [Paracoccaceae bacterium]